MQKINITSVFISAPFGFDLNFFKQIFNEHNIVTSDQSLLKLGDSIPEAINKAIRQSDLFCAIIPNSENTNNIFFEIGLAFAKNKQILLFVEKSVELPLELKNFPHSLLNFENVDSMRFYIESFLEYGTVKKRRKTSQPIKKSVDQSLIDKEQREISRNKGFEFEKNIEQIFKGAGYLTKSQPKITNKQIDLALWIDKFENYFENPILVEVKYGDINQSILKTSESQLRENLKETGGDLGLIIYNDKQGRHYSELSKEVPLIIKFSTDELINLIKTDEFESEIIKKRNEIAHGML